MKTARRRFMVPIPIEMVVQAGRRARDLVDQILTFSRRSEHERVAVDLRLVVNEVLKLIRSTLPSTIEIRQNIGRTGAGSRRFVPAPSGHNESLR